MATSSSSDKLTKVERDLIVKALEIHEKSLERASRANTGTIAAAFDEAAKFCGNLVAKIRVLPLEL